MGTGVEIRSGDGQSSIGDVDRQPDKRATQWMATVASHVPESQLFETHTVGIPEAEEVISVLNLVELGILPQLHESQMYFRESLRDGSCDASSATALRMAVLYEDRNADVGFGDAYAFNPRMEYWKFGKMDKNHRSRKKLVRDSDLKLLRRAIIHTTPPQSFYGIHNARYRRPSSLPETLRKEGFPIGVFVVGLNPSELFPQGKVTSAEMIYPRGVYPLAVYAMMQSEIARFERHLDNVDEYLQETPISRTVPLEHWDKT